MTTELSAPAHGGQPGGGRVEHAYYFAFGANMASRVLRRRAVTPLDAQSARLHDFTLDFRQRGIRPVEPCFASVRPSPGAVVHGVCYAFSPADMARLDDYERAGYDRREVQVVSGAAGSVVASLYVARDLVDGRRPSRRYLNLLIEGASEHGLPAEYVDGLRAMPVAPFAALAAGMTLVVGGLERVQRAHPLLAGGVRRLYRTLR